MTPMMVQTVQLSLTLRAVICDIYVTFHPYVVRRVFLATRSSPNACNWRQAQADERG